MPVDRLFMRPPVMHEILKAKGGKDISDFQGVRTPFEWQVSGNYANDWNLPIADDNERVKVFILGGSSAAMKFDGLAKTSSITRF